MLPFYMTAETRQALIAESNRLIAMRAALHATGARREPRGAHARHEDARFSPEAGGEAEATSESAFARLVSDLQSTMPAALG
jgi:hypothetical protein